MSYIGNPIVSTDFPVDYKSGNGSTTAFTLSIAPASVNSIDVQISGVSQSPQTYTVSGTTLTFSAAPPTGTNNIVVRHLGIAGSPNVPALGSVVPASINSSYSLWNLSGSDVNYTAGNVGIGTSSPSSYSASVAIVAPATVQALALDVASGYNTTLQFASAGSSKWLLQNLNSSNAFRFYDTTANAERMRIDSSGNLQFNSGYGSAVTAYGCRAWVNFNGTGTVAIRGSGNVSSITDNGTGDYTINFSTAMPDVNYATVGTCQFTITGDRNVVVSAPYNAAPTTSAIRICTTGGTTANLIDMPYVSVSVTR